MIRTKYTLPDFESARDGLYPGPDLEWFAIDVDGNVGAFCNAGYGPVPSTVFSSWELFNRTLDTIAALPAVGNDRWIVEKPPRCVTWKDWACAGLFAFDWQYAPSPPSPELPYDLYAIPTRPLLVSELPTDVAEYISQSKFDSLEFAKSKHLLP
jgi:hypothetical protein